MRDDDGGCSSAARLVCTHNRWFLWVRSISGFNVSEARVSVNLNKKRFGREREEDERRAGESEREGERILSPLNTNIRACSHNKSIFIINILHSFLRQRLQPAVSSHFNTAARLSTFLSWRTVISSHPGTVLISGVSAEKRRIKIIFVVLSTANTAGNKASRLRLQLGSSHLYWTELRTERREKDRPTGSYNPAVMFDGSHVYLTFIFGGGWDEGGVWQEVETFPSVFLVTNNQNKSTALKYKLECKERYIFKVSVVFYRNVRCWHLFWWVVWKAVKQHCVQGRDGKFPGKYAKMKHHRNLLWYLTRE